MTTLAFDGKTICVDSQLTEGNFAPPVEVEKIEHLSGNYYMVVVGNAGVEFELSDYLCGLLENNEMSPMTISTILKDLRNKDLLDEKTQLFIFDDSAKILHQFYLHVEGDHSTLSYYTWTKPIAFGSGRRFAMGVLALGITAQYAVASAMVCDRNTGGVIYTIGEGDTIYHDIRDLAMPSRWHEMSSDFFKEFNECEHL